MGLQHDHFRFNQEYFDHYYLCHYQPQSRGADDLSRSLIRFKNRWPVDLRAWTECSVAELKKIAWSRDTIIIRPLQSDELEITNRWTAMDKLGIHLAMELGLTYMPEILVKTKMVRELKRLSRVEREEELEGAYRLKEGLDEMKNLLIIDDISTSGTTIKSIISVVRTVQPTCAISIYTLAQTDTAELNAYINLRGFQYQWEPQEGWVVAEDLVYYISLDTLKRRIMEGFDEQ